MKELTPELKSLFPFKPNFLPLDGLQYHFIDENPYINENPYIDENPYINENRDINERQTDEQVSTAEEYTLLLVHGNPTWSFYYRNIIEAFSSRCRVVVPDHIGCGLSDKPQDYRYTLTQHIDNLQRLVESLGLKNIVLCVHDWGGPIGMGLATRFPELIRGVVVFNTVAFWLPVVPWYLRLGQLSLFGDVLIRRMNLFNSIAAKVGTVRPGRMTADIKQGYLFPYGSYQDRIAVQRFVQDIPLKPAHVSYAALNAIEQRLPLLSELPMKIIWGMKDPVFTPLFLEHWRKFFPAAEVAEFPDAGHYVVEDATDEIIELMSQFLDAVAADTRKGVPNTREGAHRLNDSSDRRAGIGTTTGIVNNRR